MLAKDPTPDTVTNGAALAAFLAAGIGAFAMGLVVLLKEVGLFSAPAIYGPSGGVTGRTALAAVLWLIAWAVLHRRWRGRQIDDRRVHQVTLGLIGLGVLLCFPPLWGILG